MRWTAFILLSASAGLAQNIGSNACRDCHPAQHQAQSNSPHARSLGPPGQHRLAASFGPVQAQWAFGAGSQAVTFVSQAGPLTYLEHRLTYYPSLKRFAPTPGHQGLSGPGTFYPLYGADAAILRCFLCHSTGAPAVSESGAIQPAENGVRCEVCHGPGALHARSPSPANILNPKRYSAGEINQFCGSCHRKPAAAGDDTDFFNDWNTRHQPLSLSQSRCFTQSRGKLSCLTCHDSHTQDTRPECGSCHPRPRHTPRVRTARRTCVECHMPRVRPVEGLRFANHWIGIYAAGQNLVPRRR